MRNVDFVRGLFFFHHVGSATRENNRRGAPWPIRLLACRPFHDAEALFWQDSRGCRKLSSTPLRLREHQGPHVLDGPRIKRLAGETHSPLQRAASTRACRMHSLHEIARRMRSEVVGDPSRAPPPTISRADRPPVGAAGGQRMAQPRPYLDTSLLHALVRTCRAIRIGSGRSAGRAISGPYALGQRVHRPPAVRKLPILGPGPPITGDPCRQ